MNSNNLNTLINPSLEAELDKDAKKILETIHPSLRTSAISYGLRLLVKTSIYGEFYIDSDLKEKLEELFPSINESMNQQEDLPSEEVDHKVEEKVEIEEVKDEVVLTKSASTWDAF